MIVLDVTDEFRLKTDDDRPNWLGNMVLMILDGIDGVKMWPTMLVVGGGVMMLGVTR